MAIQIPNPGTGNGATGDNEFVLWSKVKDNFTDQTNAAGRLMGTGDNQVIDASMAFFSANTKLNGDPDVFDCDTFPGGTRYYFNNGSGKTINLPPVVYTSQVWLVETIAIANFNTLTQYATNGISGDRFRRTYWSGSTSGWTEWLATSANKQSYDTTTASGANVAVSSTGKLMRSTSSERYKDILAPLELDDARYADAMALKPIVYRSTAGADNPAYHYYSFSAEELGAYDPAFTLWRETETVTDADGNASEQPLAERQAEGININALLAMGHAIAIKQGELIKALEARIEILEAK